MASELDALQLNITGSNRKAIESINGIINSLNALGQKLGMISTSGFSDKSKEIVSSIENIGSAVNSIDSNKIKSISSSLNNLANSFKKLSEFGSQVNSSTSGVSKAVKDIANSFSEEFGVEGKKGTEALTKAIQSMYSTMESGNSPTREQFQNIENLVKEFSNLHKSMQPVISDWQKVRDYISNSNIALPDMTGEWGDDYKRKRAILGIKNTTTDKRARQTDFSNQIAEMNTALGTTFDITKPEADILNDVVAYIEKGKTSASELAQEFWNTQENSKELKDSIYQMMGSLMNVADKSQELNSNLSNIDSSPFENIVNGLESISNVDIPDFSNITTLSNAVIKIGSDTGTRAAENLKPIADGIREFSNVSIPQLEGITEFAQGLRSLGSKNVAVAASSLKPIGEALQSFPTNIPAISGLTELAQALSMFGRKTAVQAVETIPKLAKAFGQLITELSSAPTISRNIIDLADALARFVSNVNRVGTSSKQATKGLNLFGNAASKTSKKAFSLASAIGKVYATYFLLFRAFGKIKNAIDISSDLKEVQNVVDTTFGNMTDKVEEFASTSIKEFGMSELSAKKYSSRFQAMGVAMGISAKSIEKAQTQLNKINNTLGDRGYSNTANSIADMSLNITKLTADMASFYNVAQEDVAKDLESIWTGMTRPLRQYGLDLTEATLKEWALKNGLDANIKSMSQAEKTLLRYQYVLANTSAAQGDFAKTSPTWANQIRMLGQNFERLGQVIGSGFIAWLRPAVVAMNNAMDSIIAAVQRVVNALGKIFGWEMIIDKTGQSLVDDTEGVADAWDDATGSAKKYKQQLLGIDELNNLTTKDSGSGSGDSDLLGGLSGSNLIEPGGIEFKKFDSDIDNLFDLGKKISDALKNGLAGIDWNSIYEKAAGFGIGLADFLNGLIQPETFYQIGRTVAGLLNTVSDAIISFFKEADWKQYGDAFIAGLQGFFEEIDISTIGLVIGAITIKKVGKWIFGGGAIKALGASLGKAIPASGGISAMFGGLSSGAILVGGAITALVAGLGLVYATNEDVRKSFAESVGAIKDSLSPALEFIGNTVIPNIVTGFQGLYDIIKPMGEFIETVFVSLWQDMINPALKDIGENILPPLSKAFEHLWTGVIVPLADIIGGILGPVIQTVAGIMTDLWKNVVVPLAQGLGEVLSSAIQVVIALFNAVVVVLTPVIKIIEVLWNATLKPLAEWLLGTFRGVLNSLFIFIGDIIKGITKLFSGILDFITGVFTLNWEKAWNGVAKIFEGVFYALGSFVELFVNLLIDGINFFLDGINWATAGISELTGKDLKIKRIEKFQIKGFENGGFPEQGSLFVAGETYGKSEWVGNINGRTGVASGAEITGIADAIYQTSSQEIAVLRQQNEYLYGILQKEFGITRNQIGREAQGYAKEYYGRTGKQAYQF